MPGPASTVLLTVTGLEALVLIFRIPSPRGRVEHVRLLLLVLALAADEVAPPGLGRGLAVLAVATAQGNVLAPRHRLTRIQNIVALLSATSVVAVRLAAVSVLPVAATVAVATLEGFSLAQLLEERHWMGGAVFAALAASGAVWLGGSILGILPGLTRPPLPGLPLALALIPAVPAWWFAPDGPFVSRWQLRAARLEGRLQRAEALLETQSRLTALGFVAAGAAHEFRASLSGIGALARWARDAPTPASKDEALETIVRRAGEAHGAVVPLLEQIAGGDREAIARVDLARTLGPLLSYVRATCRREGITVIYEATDAPVVNARRTEIEHVVMNLLRNAAEAARAWDPGGRTVRVRVFRDHEHGVVEVEDDAGGVSEDRQATLFRPAGTRPGAGVGLYIARGLATRNGGSLSYVGRPGGSLFRLRLPLDAADAGGAGV